MKLYVEPVIEIAKFNVDDVITTSDPDESYDEGVGGLPIL